jgi:SAM-dependent methyltransferase
VFCPSCNSKETSFIGKIPHTNQFAGKTLRKFLPGGSLYKCISCHVYFRWPRFSDEYLSSLYKEGSESAWKYNFQDRTDWKIAAKWLHEKLGGGTVIDIGCFDGEFLRNLGSEWVPYGVEINQVVAQHAERLGITIVAQNLDEIGDLSYRFDAVVAFDFIEHMNDPRSFLSTMAKVTNSGGFIIISTGSTDALSWKFMGSRYWYCSFAEHVSFINREWCDLTAQLLDLCIEHYEIFSHAGNNRTLVRVARETFKSAFYKFFPHLFGRIRYLASGKIDPGSYREIGEYPPAWTSAKDHILVIFRKL